MAHAQDSVPIKMAESEAVLLHNITLDSAMAASQNGFCPYKFSFV